MKKITKNEMLSVRYKLIWEHVDTLSVGFTRQIYNLFVNQHRKMPGDIIDDIA